ncbi:unnamed protein product [Timema podura]|uniref:Uncharacterized protein n=1 Tax=Timema podura TaxID=61482 RepID=A0ABN7NYL5_TIMPD|nr:unnamed protein product [Timema podura]
MFQHFTWRDNQQFTQQGFDSNNPPPVVHMNPSRWGTDILFGTTVITSSRHVFLEHFQSESLDLSKSLQPVACIRVLLVSLKSDSHRTPLRDMLKLTAGELVQDMVASSVDEVTHPLAHSVLQTG